MLLHELAPRALIQKCLTLTQASEQAGAIQAELVMHVAPDAARLVLRIRKTLAVTADLAVPQFRGTRPCNRDDSHLPTFFDAISARTICASCCDWEWSCRSAQPATCCKQSRTEIRQPGTGETCELCANWYCCQTHGGRRVTDPPDCASYCKPCVKVATKKFYPEPWEWCTYSQCTTGGPVAV